MGPKLTKLETPEQGNTTNIAVINVNDNTCLNADNKPKRVEAQIPPTPQKAFLPSTYFLERPPTRVQWKRCSESLLSGTGRPTDPIDPHNQQLFNAFWNTDSTNLGVSNTALLPQNYPDVPHCVSLDAVSTQPGTTLNVIPCRTAQDQALLTNQWNPRTLNSILSAAEDKFQCIGADGTLSGQGSSNPRCLPTATFRTMLYKPGVAISAGFYIRDTLDPDAFLSAVPPPFLANRTSALFLPFNGSQQQQWTIRPLSASSQPVDQYKQYQTFAEISIPASPTTKGVLRLDANGASVVTKELSAPPELEEQFSIPLLQVALGTGQFLRSRPLVVNEDDVLYSGAAPIVQMVPTMQQIVKPDVVCESDGNCYAQEFAAIDYPYEFVPTTLWPNNFFGQTLTVSPGPGSTATFSGTSFAPFVPITTYTVTTTTNPVIAGVPLDTPISSAPVPIPLTLSYTFPDPVVPDLSGNISGSIPAPPNLSSVQIGNASATFVV